MNALSVFSSTRMHIEIVNIGRISSFESNLNNTHVLSTILTLASII